MAVVKWIAICFGALVALLVVIGLVLPSSAYVSRSIVVAAAPEDVFPYINSLKKFNEWSPWYEWEPDADYVFEGPEEGVGARLVWSGEVVGSGSQEITLSEENKKVEAALDFGAQGTAVATYYLESVDGGTEVTWSFSTDVGMNLMGRYMNLLMDKWVGADYEQGLSNLKALVEGQP